MKYAFVVTALLASVTIAAGRQPQFKSGVEVVYLDVTEAFGWFGGGGRDGTVSFFTTQLGVPAFIAALVTLGEFLGGLGVVTGTLTRVAAADERADRAECLKTWPNRSCAARGRRHCLPRSRHPLAIVVSGAVMLILETASRLAEDPVRAMAAQRR